MILGELIGHRAGIAAVHRQMARLLLRDATIRRVPTAPPTCRVPAP